MLALARFKLYKDRVIPDALYPLPRDDKLVLLAESEDAGLAYDDKRRYPSRTDVKFKVPGAPELCTVAEVYNLLDRKSVV